MVPTGTCQPRGLTQEGFLRVQRSNFWVDNAGGHNGNIVGQRRINEMITSHRVLPHNTSPGKANPKGKKSHTMNVLKITNQGDGKIVDK